MKRKILGITGIRSDYDITSPVFEAIRDHNDLNLELAVCGSHLSQIHGYSIKNIENDGYKIADTIEYLVEGRKGIDRAVGVGMLIIGLVQTVNRIKPDIILVSGDREEPIAGAIVGNYYNIPVAHLFGGDSAINNADDPIRHGTSKISHIHFPTCEEHSERLKKMGEENFRIFPLGSPSLDRYVSTPHLNREEIRDLIDLDIINKPFIVLIQHPLSSEQELAYKHMKITMEAIKELKINTVVIYPNSDPGSSDVIKAIEEYRDIPFINIFKNFNRLHFVNLLRQAHCLIGNSSCGLLEAQFLKLPVVNIGNRQKGRTNAGNVIFVPNNKNLIVKTINDLIYNDEFREHHISKINQLYYGDGKSATKIAEVLATIRIDNKLLLKKNTF